MSIKFTFRHWRSAALPEESSDSGDEDLPTGKTKADNRKERQKKLIRASSFPAGALLRRLSLTPATALSTTTSTMPSLNPQTVRVNSHPGAADKMANCVRSRPSQWKRVQETKSEALISQNPFIKQVWRIVVMGAGYVGKTSVLSRFIAKQFPEHISKNHDEMHRLDYQVASQVITVELLDTSGYGSFPAMREVAIRQADGFLLVFSPDCEESLECVKSLRQDILRIKQTEQNAPVIPMVVVCNKMDLDIAQHKVDLPYVDFLVKCDWENCGLIQASAKDDYGVQEAFRELLLGLKLRLPSNTIVKRMRGGLSRMRSAPAGLRTEGSIKFSSPKLLQKFRERSIAIHEDECIVN